MTAAELALAFRADAPGGVALEERPTHRLPAFDAGTIRPILKPGQGAAKLAEFRIAPESQSSIYLPVRNLIPGKSLPYPVKMIADLQTLDQMGNNCLS